MSTKSKAKYFNFKTARGVAMYPKLNRPVKFDNAAKKSVEDPEGKYEVLLAVDAGPAKKMIDGIIAVVKEWGVCKDVKKIKHFPWKAEVDKETDEETGRMLFKFKQYGQNKDGTVKRILHSGADGKPLPKGFALAMRNTGSEIKISASASYYNQSLGDGISLSVDAVQVLMFERGDGNSSNWDAEEGFTADDLEDATNASNEDGDDNSGTTDF